MKQAEPETGGTLVEDIYAGIKLVIQNDDGIKDSDLDGIIDIGEAVIALEEALPELPAGYKWRVDVNT